LVIEKIIEEEFEVFSFQFSAKGGPSWLKTEN